MPRVEITSVEMPVWHPLLKEVTYNLAGPHIMPSPGDFKNARAMLGCIPNDWGRVRNHWVQLHRWSPTDDFLELLPEVLEDHVEEWPELYIVRIPHV